MKNIGYKWNYFCLWVWIKWHIKTEDIRLKASDLVYWMDSKIKDR